MKKNMLLWTNSIVCIIIVVGFIITAIISYRSNMGMFVKDLEHVSTLTSEGIYYQIDSTFSAPVNVSLTMANDSLLKSFLAKELTQKDDEDYLAQLTSYLLAYRQKYSYDSVFLVSTQTNRYYHYKGLDRILTADNPENVWYFNFLENEAEYSLNIDNDEAARDNVTVFVNCKIHDEKGNIVGIVGVGMEVANLQEMFAGYQAKYGVDVNLLSEDGVIQVSSNDTGYEAVNFFANGQFENCRERIFSSREERQTFWDEDATESTFLVAEYVPALDWYLVVANNTAPITKLMQGQLIRAVLVIGTIILLVVLTIAAVIRRYNWHITNLNLSHESEYERLLHESTQGVHKAIHEYDVTKGVAISEATKKFLEKLAIFPNTPYDIALKLITEKRVKAEYRQNYLDTFLTEPLLALFDSGERGVSCELEMLLEDGQYHWLRISGHLFFWETSQSIRLITYMVSMDTEKTLKENAQTISQELEYRHLIAEATDALYDSVFEFDITNDKVCLRDGVPRYLEIQGLPEGTAYEAAMRHYAANYVAQEFREGYIEMFRCGNLKTAYQKGITSFVFDFMTLGGVEEGHWVRVIGRTFFWESDGSLRMITYRQNIDAEKKRELSLVDKSQRDSLTELYGKRATEEFINSCLKESSLNDRHALFLFDIDNFKYVNDTMGHGFGDQVIWGFAVEIQKNFREADIIGRVGGDEFVVLMKNCGDEERVRMKLLSMCKALIEKSYGEGQRFAITASIGAALFPEHGGTYSALLEKADQALYFSKGHGKNTFQIYDESLIGKGSFLLNQRDLAVLINETTDGVAKIACAERLRILYFNQKMLELCGMTTEQLSAPEFDPMSQVCPEDRAYVEKVLEESLTNQSAFQCEYRLLYADGRAIPVIARGVFVGETYENRYPIFYIIYTKK